MADEKKLRTTSKTKLSREIRKLNEALDDEYPVAEIHKRLEALYMATDDVEDCHERYISALDHDDPDAADWINAEITRSRCARKKAMDYVKQLESTAGAAVVTGSRPVNSTLGTPSKVKLKAIDYPVFSGKPREYQEWKKEYEGVIKPRLTGVSDAELTMCLKNCLSQQVKDKLTPDCKSEDAIMKELDRQYGVKDRVINQILDDVMKLGTPPAEDAVKSATFYRAILSAVHDLADFDSELCIKNPAVVASLVRKLPTPVRDKWWETVYSLNGNIMADEDKPESFIKFVKWQLNIADEMAVAQSAKQSTPSKKAGHTNVAQKEKEQSADAPAFNMSKCKVCLDGTHPIWKCRQFRTMTAKDRMGKVLQLKLCFRCLKGKHRAVECQHKNPRLCRKCDKGHNYMLHSDPDDDSAAITVTAPPAGPNASDLHTSLETAIKSGDMGKIKEISTQLGKLANVKSTACVAQAECSLDVKEPPVIMMVQYAFTSKGDRVSVLWDTASDTNYCTNDLAKRLKLNGEPFSLVINGIGDKQTRIDTVRYVLKLKTRIGIVPIVVYGIDEIATMSNLVDNSSLPKLFPDYSAKQLKRPTKCEILLSQANASLMPTKHCVVGDLVLWKGPLGIVVSGSHPDLEEECVVTAKRSVTHLAFSLKAMVESKENKGLDMQIHTLEMSDFEFPVDELPSCYRCRLSLYSNAKEMINWFQYDQIGAACTPKCGSCRCGNCVPGGKQMTLKEERELKQIEDCLTFRPDGDDHSPESHWDAKYPYLVNPSQLPANYTTVKGVLMSTLRRLNKDPEWRKVYESQIAEMVKRGAARKLSDEEIQSWKGPVWYIAHQIAPNPTSKSTPCRLVWNSSQPVDGCSLNSILVKGPDVLNPIRCVLLRFREGVHGFIGDVSKMYNSVYLEENEIHLHRFLWPNDSTGEIDTYAILRVNIGDRPAACLAMLATRLTAQLPEFAEMHGPVDTILNSMYVDDILDSTDSPEEVERLQSGVEQILARGGFRIKLWMTSGVKPPDRKAAITLPNALKESESTALGMGYDAENDLLYVKGSINFSKKMQKMHIGPDLTEDAVEDELPNQLTKRVVLSQLMSTFDPCGLVAPFKMKGAILFRKTWQMTLGKDGKFADWDQPIPGDLVPEWLHYFKATTRVSTVQFPRSLKTCECNNPDLITFSDGSDHAFGAVVYVRWEAEPEAIVRIIEAKAKLCPLNQKGDTVKSEMCGAVFAARLASFVQVNSRIEFQRVYHFVDSMTVLGAINKESYGFSTFYANRVGEIRASTDPDNWFWISSHDNPADLVTRGALPEDLSKDSAWQTGPEWLKRPTSEWPVSSRVSEESDMQILKLQRKAFSQATTRSQASQRSPQCEAASKDTSVGGLMNKNQLLQLRDIVGFEHYSSFSKLLRSTATLQALAEAWKNFAKPVSKNKRGNLILPLNPEQLKKAETLIFQIAQLDLEAHGKLEKLVPTKDESTGLVLTCGRLGSDFDPNFNVPILPPGEVAHLLALDCHNRGHSGVDATMVKLRSRAWVIRGRKIVKAIVYSCVTCRKVRKHSLNQVMADIPNFRLLPSPPFSYCSVDFFGPIMVRGEVNKRSRGKVWGCVYACLSCRAVHVDIARDYSTDGFLLVHRRFQAMRGCPKIIYSDPAKNFVGAASELKKFAESISQDELKLQGGKVGSEWRFHPPDAPHANGAVEIMVKLVKKSLYVSANDATLSFTELQTVCYEAAELVNERPLAITHTRGNADLELNYLCPNQLLLGRASAYVPATIGTNTSNTVKRIEYVDKVANRFWQMWYKVVFPSLVIRPKWHVECRNVKVGDVVMVADQNAVRGNYQLALVSEVYPDEKGRVRHVQVSYKLDGGKKYTSLKRDVRRLILLLPVEEQSPHDGVGGVKS